MLPQIATAYDRNPARIQMIIRKNRNQKKETPMGVLIGVNLAAFAVFSYLMVMVTL